MRYLTGWGNVRCGMHLVRQISVGHLSGWGNVRRDLSGRGIIRRGCVWSRKRPSGMCLVEEVSIRDVCRRENICRGRVPRGNVRRGCVQLQ